MTDNPPHLFEAYFRATQEAVGLMHYDINFESVDLAHFAEIEAEAEDCVAEVRYNAAKCEAAGNVQSTAVHECLHLLLADFEHACMTNPKAARIEEERIVRRLEAIVTRGIFANKEGAKE